MAVAPGAGYFQFQMAEKGEVMGAHRPGCRKGSQGIKKRLLRDRKNRKCCYCGRYLRTNEATLEHVIPISKGGYTKKNNCKIACRKCNEEKGSMALGTYMQMKREKGE